NGSYTYAVRAVYADGCESLSYNTVKVAIDFTGIGEKGKKDGIVVYPNPASYELRVTSYELRVTSIEVLDVFGRNMGVKFLSFGGAGVVNISHLPQGIYFMRITTEEGLITKKIVKR
ncbi:MAG: T9SS type A sorting domain-containing protein, partial [Bacteroidales bacterium]|nr:T9SS type A sorting domain-containing protein [Bacteroidales bacterium]